MSTEYEAVVLVGAYLDDIYKHCKANDLLDVHDYEDMWDFRDRSLGYYGIEVMGDCEFIGFQVDNSFDCSSGEGWAERVEELMGIFQDTFQMKPVVKACVYSY